MDIGNAAAAFLLITAFVTDIRTRKIPNLLTVSFGTAALLYHLWAHGLSGFGFSLAGMAFGLMVFYVLYAMKGIGAGDVKLFAALGAWVGVASVWEVMMYSILYAGGAGLALILFRRKSIRNMRFPFMIAVLPGAVTGWLMMN